MSSNGSMSTSPLARNGCLALAHPLLDCEGRQHGKVGHQYHKYFVAFAVRSGSEL